MHVQYLKRESHSSQLTSQTFLLFADALPHQSGACRRVSKYLYLDSRVEDSYFLFLGVLLCFPYKQFRPYFKQGA